MQRCLKDACSSSSQVSGIAFFGPGGILGESIIFGYTDTNVEAVFSYVVLCRALER